VKKQRFQQLMQSQVTDGTAMLPIASVSTGTVPSPTPTRCLESANLLGDAREVTILHNGRQYRLRITAQQKLILTA
jgi:hemin uptake protein HemP